MLQHTYGQNITSVLTMDLRSSAKKEVKGKRKLKMQTPGWTSEVQRQTAKQIKPSYCL